VSAAGPWSRRRLLRGAAVVVVALLLAGAAFAVTRAVRDRYAVPTADLLDSATPSAPAPATTASPTPTAGAGITGPLDILLVGVDTRVRVPDWQPHADAVLLLHVPAGLDRAYLYSLPRDLLVDVPAFAPARFGGGRIKLTETMSYGSRVPGRSRPDPAQGFRLLTRTVSRYTGIESFDAAAVLNFPGFERLVNALDGVDIYVDQRVASLQRRPDGGYRTPNPYGEGYLGPQMVYEKGRQRLNGWQALDYARQRYLPGGAYTRQRHQQQLIKAIVREVADSGLARDPARLDAVLRAVATTLIFDGRGRSPVDFAYALRDLPPERITLVALPGTSVGGGGGYLGEQLTAVGRRFLRELAAGRVDAFLAGNPKLVIRN
jgi:LCP family protein required for cell wall assembly